MYKKREESGILERAHQSIFMGLPIDGWPSFSQLRGQQILPIIIIIVVIIPHPYTVLTMCQELL